MLQEGDRVKIINVKGIYGEHLFCNGDTTEIVKLEEYPNHLALKSKTTSGGLILLPGDEKYLIKIKGEEF